MSNALTVVTSDPPAPKNKRERIALVEIQPEADWFVPAKTKRGKQIWYLRFRMTGRNPRLYGPFKSKHHCLLCLDEVINEILGSDFESMDDDRMLNEPCAKVWPPIVEYPICGTGKQL